MIIPQWMRDAMDTDPLVREAQERDRHPQVWREPAVDGQVTAISVHLCCPHCLCKQASMILEEVMRAEGVMRCPGCAGDLVIPSEDLPSLVALRRAKDAGDFARYLQCIQVIQDRCLPPFLDPPFTALRRMLGLPDDGA